MKKILFLMIASFIMVGCNENEPYNNSNNSKEISVSFVYNKTGALTIRFTNRSTGVSSYKWDFGDGSTSTEKNPVHKYSKIGKYVVTLTGDGIYECKANITINQPKIYVSGWKIYKIPYQNKYYKLKMYDDDWFGSDWYFTTEYTKSLGDSDLPYTINFNNPKLMDKLDGDNYYNVYLYYSGNTSSGGTECFHGKMTKENIYKYWDEHVWTSSDGKTKIGVLMEYR